MYLQKILEPDSVQRLRASGYGMGNAAGVTQQKVWPRSAQTRPSSGGGAKENVTVMEAGEYSLVPRADPFTVEGKHGATVERAMDLADQRVQQQISDTKERLDMLKAERNSLPVPPSSNRPDLFTILFGRGSAAPSKEETDRASVLDIQIAEAEEALIWYEDQIFRRDVAKLYGQAGIDGWDQFLQYKEEKELAAAERLANETWQDRLGRYMSGNTRDTTLPFHVDEIQLAEGHRAQERGKREPDDRWTNAQKAEFGYLWGSSPERAGNYAAWLNKELDAGEKAEEIGKVREWSAKNPVNATLATAGSILFSAPAGMADFLNDVTAYGTLGYIPGSSGSADLWDISQAVTSGVSEKMNSWGTLPEAIPVLGGKGMGDVYGLGVNVLQSYLAAASGGPGQAVITFIGPAAAAAKDDALSRGADDETALTYGAVIGLIEAGAEAIGAENVTKLISSGGLKALLSTPGMGEALEEGAASLAGFVADVLILREDSEFARRVAEYEKDGKSRAGAVAGAAWDTLEDILYDSMSGWVSGETHAGFSKVWSAVSKALGGKNRTVISGKPAASTEAQPKAPAGTGPHTNTSSNTSSPYAGADSRSKPRIAGTETNTDIRDTDASASDRTKEPEGPWTDTETDARTAGDTATDMDGVYGAEGETDTGKADRQKPVRYEDALKAYLRGDMDLSEKPDVRNSIPNTDTDAGPVVGTDIAPETAPKPKTQVIAELAPKLQRPGTTPGRAMIAAQEMYAEAEKWYGSNADTVLEMFQPGQDSRKFLDGFRNAYLSGKMGDSTALKNSGVAAYLTDGQREVAFAMGAQAVGMGSDHGDMRTVKGALQYLRETAQEKKSGGGQKALPPPLDMFPENDIMDKTRNRQKRHFWNIMSRQKGIPQDYLRMLTERFDGGTDLGKKVFLKYVTSDSVADFAEKGRNRFSRKDLKVYINAKKDMSDPRGPGTGSFHEYGHYVDYFAAGAHGDIYLSTSRPEFEDLLFSDFDACYRDFEQRHGTDRPYIFECIGLSIDGTKYHAVQDLFGGLSYGEYVGEHKHKPEDWEVEGAFAKEAFAHMFAAQFDAEKHRIMEQYFPSALEYFERMLEDIS